MNWLQYFIICLGGFTLSLYICLLTVKPVQGRAICVRPPYMQTTQSCNRVPTLAKPYCPAPEGY